MYQCYRRLRNCDWQPVRHTDSQLLQSFKQWFRKSEPLTAGAQHEERGDVEQQVHGDVGDGQQRRPGAVAAARRRHAAKAPGACIRNEIPSYTAV